MRHRKWMKWAASVMSNVMEDGSNHLPDTVVVSAEDAVSRTGAARADAAGEPGETEGFPQVWPAAHHREKPERSVSLYAKTSHN